jgi:hypothetical protein
MSFFTPSHQLTTKVTDREQQQHEAYLIRCSILECRNQIKFHADCYLNNSNAPIEIQRQMINAIYCEEIKIAKLELELKKYNN